MPSPDIFASVFSPGDFSEFDATNGTPEIVTSPVHCGGYAAKFNANAETVEISVSNDELYCRFYVRYDTEPAAGVSKYIRNVNFLGTGGTVSVGRCYMESQPGGKQFRMYGVYPATTSWVYAYNWQINTWYQMEFYFKKHASTGRYKMWMNEALICDSGDLNTSGAPTVDTVRVGTDYADTPAFTNVFVDCIAIADSGPIGTHQDFNNGFESGDFSGYDAVVGSPSITELKLHCGSYACECDVSPTNSEGPYVNLGHHKEVYLQFEVKFEDTTPPASGRVYFAYIRESTDSVNILSLFIYNDAGTVKWGYTYRDAGSSTTVNSAEAGTTDPVADTWYCVELKIVMSSRDGDAEGSYAMYIDDTLLSDIDQSAIDTDYTGVSVLRLVTYTTVAGGATTYYDCVTWQDTDVGACHAAGSVEPVTLESEADCTPPDSPDWLRVYRNCQRVYIADLTVDAGERGIGTLTIPYATPVARGDLYHVIVEGSVILQGKVVGITKNRAKGIKTLQCQSKTARLYGRFVLSGAHRAYTGEDVGAIAKDLIDYYFEGLYTSTNVVSNTGITISDFDCYDKSVGTALEELAKRGNCAFYVDDNSDVHFFVKGTEKSRAIFDSSNIVGDLVDDEVGEVIKKVIVKGVTGISGEAGSGIPEHLHSDRRITTNAEAQEVAEALLTNFGETVTTKFPVRGFYGIKQGQGAVLDMPLDGYDYSSVIVERISWALKPGNCVTNITIGALPISYENLLLQVFKAIKEQQVNRISNHSGTSSGDGDPALEYNDILATAMAAEVRVQTTDVTLQSGVCGSEADSANMALIIVEINIGGSGGSGYFILRLLNTTTGDHYEEWLCYMDTDLNQYHKRCLVLDNLGGDTIQISAEGYGSTDVYVRGQITVRQILQHSHDVTQALQHEFD